MKTDFQNSRTRLVLAVLLSFTAYLPVASAWAEAIASDESTKKEVLTCKKRFESPCTIDSPCHGVFTYCAETQQCRNAKSFAISEWQCVSRAPRRFCCSQILPWEEEITN
jgi:hypothetical protein